MMSSVKWSLQNTTTNEVIQITKAVFKVGRHFQADIKSKSGVLSRNHAVLLLLIDGLYVQDKKSCNGTFINNKNIPAYEQFQLNHGDEVGFGWCTSKEILTPCKEDVTPCVFRVLNEGPKDDEPTTSTGEELNVKDDDEECIVISDDENEDPFACSQILEISAKMKNEPSFLADSIDPYFEIKQELRDLDFCECIAYDLTDQEQEQFKNDSDLLRVLESQETSEGTGRQSNEGTARQSNEGTDTHSNEGRDTHSLQDSSSEMATSFDENSSTNETKEKPNEEFTKQTNDILVKHQSSSEKDINESDINKKDQHKKTEKHHNKKSGECNAKKSEHNNKKPEEHRDQKSKHNEKNSESLDHKTLEDKKLTVVLNKLHNSHSKYVKPPIVNPHIQERKSSTNLNATATNERKRRKSVSSDTNKKMKTNDNADALKVVEISKDQKEKIVKERKRKLQKLCEKNKPVESNKLTKTTPKVKVSESRGHFLLKESSIPVSSNSKTASAVKKNPGNKRDPRSYSKRHSTRSVSTQNIPESAKSASKKHIQDSRKSARERCNSQSSKLGIEIQDTTVTSNFSPNINSSPSDTASYMSNETARKLNFSYQRPDSTVEIPSFGTTIRNMMAPFSNNGGRHRNDRYHDLDNMDTEITRIVQWPARWIEEQQNSDISPPVYDDLLPQIMSTRFKTFNDYISTMTPMIMLELWQFSYQGFCANDEHNSIKTVMLTHWRRTQNATFLDCEIQLPESELKHNVPFRVDDLIILELLLTEKKLYKCMAFGFIKYCNRTQIMIRDVPFGNLKFMIVMKAVAKPIFGNQLMLKVITNIGGFLRQLKIMKYLEVSPVLPMVLHPVHRDFSFSLEPNIKNIISGMQLNKEQMQITEEATNMCLGNTPGFYLIKGPPGTGKSTVIVNIVLEILFRSKQRGIDPLILLTAHSNTAVDNLVLKLSNYRLKLPEAQKKLLKLVRIGPDASISKNVEKHKLASLARNNIVSANNFHCLKEYNEFLKTGKDVDEFLRKQLKNRYLYEIQQAEHQLLRCSSVICTTLTSSITHRILQLTRKKELRFTCAIIDEATQCNELESLFPIQLEINKFVLVGDPQQLPAVVCNKEAQKLGLEKSLFSRIMENFGNRPVPRIKMLCEQYRMKPEISYFPNKTFYDGKLKNSPIIPNKLEPAVTPYLLFNLTKMKTDESEYINTDEVHVICGLLETLKNCIKKSCTYSIGVITPYHAQKDLLRSNINRIRFGPEVSIAVNTVDSFQGTEKDIIIISCVRYSSNNFLQNRQRLNVALTRAKQALYIVGNYTLFKECSTFYDLREDAKQRKMCLDIGGDLKHLPSFHKYIIR